MAAPARWPALPYAAWKDTCTTLHLWTQVVGQLTLTTTPLVNHWWNVALHYTSRGLATQVMDCGEGESLVAEFDFVAQELRLCASSGRTESIRLEPMSVADFHGKVMAALARLGLEIETLAAPAEIPDPIPFAKDTAHRDYDPAWANAFWRALDSMRPVFEEFRAKFIGKSSPVHFFWGSFDLALSRFSGRTALDAPGEDPMLREAYSHELVSHGFWPGGGAVSDASFYAYARPEPQGFRAATVGPAAARYFEDYQQFLLPYEAVRSAAFPEATLMDFLQSTYERAATLAHWGASLVRR